MEVHGLGHVLCRMDGRLTCAVLESLISTHEGTMQVVVYAASTAPPASLRNATVVPVPG